MNYDELKKTALNRVEVTDSLKAPLLGFSLKPTETTESNTLKIKVNKDNEEKIVQYNFTKPLYVLNNIKDEFLVEPTFKGNKVKMEAKVIRRIQEKEEKKEIHIEEDLSNKRLSIAPNILQLGIKQTLLTTDKYRILYDCNEKMEIAVLQRRAENNTYELVEILFEYSFESHETITHTKECILPEDFGIVTSVIWTTQMFEYVKDMFQIIELTGLEEKMEEEVETLPYEPIILFDGNNAISTNFSNVELEIIYPKNVDLVKYFLTTSFTYGLNNEDKFLTLDDLYFKNSFTKIEDDKINALFNKLTIKCLNSSDNNFSLDCDGNLVVNSITTKIKGDISTDLDKIYPVGSIYMSVNSTNPSNFFGGNWESWGAGRVPVGVSGTDTSFNTVEKIGGVKTNDINHTHTITSHTHGGSAQEVTGNTGSTVLTTEQMPMHKHLTGTDQHYHAWRWGDSNTETLYVNANVFSGAHPSGNYLYSRQGVDIETSSIGGSKGHTHTLGNHAHSLTINGSGELKTGSSGSANLDNLQPYITCYMWKRTA